MQFMIRHTPTLLIAYAVYLFGWTSLGLEQAVVYCLGALYLYWLTLQFITAFLLGAYHRQLFFHAGINAFISGVLGLAALLIGSITDAQVATPAASVAFLIPNSICGFLYVALFAWPFLSLLWINRVNHAYDAERQTARRQWERDTAT